MSHARTYPAGVPCWIDSEQTDPEAACRFYGELFGWEFTNVAPPQAPDYFVATLGGDDVAAIAPATTGATPAWNTYITVDDLAGAARQVSRAGGRLTSDPVDLGPPGSLAYCADPEGAEFRLWQAGRRVGAQLVNVPGAWNFSHLQTGDLASARAFYEAVFGWEYADMPGAMMWRVPGYGEHLAATVDPDIHTRQAGAPEGFADVIAGPELIADGAPPRWRVVFLCADRDDAAITATRLGGEVLSKWDTTWTRDVEVRDPQGTRLILSQFAPPQSLAHVTQ
jgi:uncharacterized protein